MKYRIVKVARWTNDKNEPCLFQIQRFIDDGMKRWQHVEHSTSSSMAEVESKLGTLIAANGKLPEDEVVQEVEV